MPSYLSPTNAHNPKPQSMQFLNLAAATCLLNMVIHSLDHAGSRRKNQKSKKKKKKAHTYTEGEDAHLHVC